MDIQRVTILEFAPTADEIWRIPQHEKDGYVSYDVKNGLVSILDTAHNAKMRPEIITIYAGGKATNVARVMDRLLMNENELCVELVTFLPPPPDGPLKELNLGIVKGVSLLPSTAAGIHVQCLQIEGLRNVRPRFEIVDELAETGKMQTTRRAIEIALGESSGSLNFSPRILWSQKAADAVRSRVAEATRGADLVVMAGSPPIWEAGSGSHLTPYSFYAKIIDVLESGCDASIDTRGQYMRECLMARRSPRFAFMNEDEFGELAGSWGELSKRSFPGTLLVHDENGCWMWDAKLPDGQNLFSQAEYFPSVHVPVVYSTIGAGDAMHAGFLKEWICAESGEQERLRRAVVYSQVVAAVAVSSEKATYGIEASAVNGKFQQVWQEMVSAS